MTQTIDMQDLMHLNLFGGITGVKTSNIFNYNNMIFFGVPKEFLRMALGENASNLKRISDKIRKRVRVVPMPDTDADLKTFFQKITEPIEFKDLTMSEDEIVINAGSMSKAALIGREKRRLLELQKIAKDFFGRNLRVI